MSRAIVFTRTKHGANRLSDQLASSGIASEAIHGNKSQNARERALEAFRKGTTRVLVATDVAARGIDIDGISHVINFDMPNIAESYVHRIGRTGRAGALGWAIAFCDRDERGLLADIERLIRRRLPVSGGSATAELAPAASWLPPPSSRSFVPHRPSSLGEGHAVTAARAAGRRRFFSVLAEYRTYRSVVFGDLFRGPRADEADFGPPVCGAYGFGIGRFEDADTVPSVERQEALKPPNSVRIEAWLELFGHAIELFLRDRRIKLILHDNARHLGLLREILGA